MRDPEPSLPFLFAGIADIVGRRFGKGLKLPYNKSKSWAGSVAMFLTGTATALL
jgi:dolichol kinase